MIGRRSGLKKWQSVGDQSRDKNWLEKFAMLVLIIIRYYNAFGGNCGFLSISRRVVKAWVGCSLGAPVGKNNERAPVFSADDGDGAIECVSALSIHFICNVFAITPRLSSSHRLSARARAGP